MLDGCEVIVDDGSHGDEGLVTHVDDIVLYPGLDRAALDSGMLMPGVLDEGGNDDGDAVDLPHVLQHNPSLDESEQSEVVHCQSLSPHAQPGSTNIKKSEVYWHRFCSRGNLRLDYNSLQCYTAVLCHPTHKSETWFLGLSKVKHILKISPKIRRPISYWQYLVIGQFSPSI